MRTHIFWSLTILIITLLVFGGCVPGGEQPAQEDQEAQEVQKPAEPQEPSLYDRLGGTHKISVVVSDFVDLVGSDERITNPAVTTRLGEINLDRLKDHLTDQICMATGGPCIYTGRDMVTAHVGLGITNQGFDYVVDDLVQALDRYDVGEREKNELLDILGPMREDIVEES